MNDLEQQCENALFELCDARERYPLQCANELQKCIQLKNDISIMKVDVKPTILSNDSNIVEQENKILNTLSIDEGPDFKRLDQKLEYIVKKFDNLKDVMEQIKSEKEHKIYKLLNNL